MYHCDGNDYEHDPVTGIYFMPDYDGPVTDEIEELQATPEYAAELEAFLVSVCG